jgi:CBS-domain-containing membrane protein
LREQTLAAAIVACLFARAKAEACTAEGEAGRWVSRDYVTAPSGTSSEGALKLLQEKKQMYLPILAEDGTLVSSVALPGVRSLTCKE